MKTKGRTSLGGKEREKMGREGGESNLSLLSLFLPFPSSLWIECLHPTPGRTNNRSRSPR